MSRKIITGSINESGSVLLWKGARVLTGEDYGGKIMIYVEYDESVTEMEERRFVMLSRNSDVPDNAIYIATFYKGSMLGSIVSHLYEVKS